MKAFSMWELVSNLKFRKISERRNENIDIEVSFVEGYHKDSNPFDGDLVIGHSFFPNDNKGNCCIFYKKYFEK